MTLLSTQVKALFDVCEYYNPVAITPVRETTANLLVCLAQNSNSANGLLASEL